MNVERNNWKVLSIIRRSGSLEFMDLVARCSLPPEELLLSLRYLTDQGLIKIQGSETLDEASTVLAEIASPESPKGPTGCRNSSAEAARASWFFALHDRYQRIGSSPVTPAP